VATSGDSSRGIYGNIPGSQEDEIGYTAPIRWENRYPLNISRVDGRCIGGDPEATSRGTARPGPGLAERELVRGHGRKKAGGSASGAGLEGSGARDQRRDRRESARAVRAQPPVGSPGVGGVLPQSAHEWAGGGRFGDSPGRSHPDSRSGSGPPVPRWTGRFSASQRCIPRSPSGLSSACGGAAHGSRDR